MLASFFRKVLRTSLRNISIYVNLKAIYTPTEDASFFSLEAGWIWNYVYAFQYTDQHKLVLDVGCGVGYGTEELARRSSHVVGMDVSRNIIGKARGRQKANLSFILADCQRLPFRNVSFDAITGFELIEHLEDPDSFLRDARRALKEGGILILSTPIRNENFEIPLAPLHELEFSPKELEALLLAHFADAKINARSIIDENWRRRQKSLIGRTLRKLRKHYFGSLIAGLYDLYLDPYPFKLDSFDVSGDFTSANSMLATAFRDRSSALRTGNRQ